MSFRFSDIQSLFRSFRFFELPSLFRSFRFFEFPSLFAGGLVAAGALLRAAIASFQLMMHSAGNGW